MPERAVTNPDLKGAKLDLETATIDEVKGVVMTIDARSETTAAEVSELKEIVGYPAKPGAFAGDPDVPGKGMAGALERLARNDVERAKTHASIAARTGGVTALVLAVVLKAAEMFLASRGALPAFNAPPPALSSHP